MTSNRSLTAASSANDAFKAHYTRSLNWAGLTAVTLTALMVWLSPDYRPTPYTLSDQAIHLKEVEVVYDLEQPAPVAAPPRLPPIIEVVAEESQIDFDPLPEGDWTRFLPPVTTVRLPSDTGFTASSRNPQLVFQAKPHYPEVARLAQVQGTVIVKVLVDAQGQVAAAEIIRGVHPLLDKAALAAARKCVFLPGQQRELKVPTWVAVPYSFHLR